MKVYIDNSVVPEFDTAVAPGGRTECTLIGVRDLGPDLQGEGFTMYGFSGTVYDENGNVLTTQELQDGLNDEQQNELLAMLQATGQLDTLLPSILADFQQVAESAVSSMIIDSAFSTSSTNPVQNKIITEALYSIAPLFDINSSYVVGDYVWYNSKLLCFIADHASGSYPSTDAVEAPITETVSRMYNAIAVSKTASVTWINGNINSSTGANSTTNQTIRLRENTYLYSDMGATISIPTGLRAYLYYYASDSQASFVNAQGWLTGFVYIPANKYFRVVISLTANTAISPSDASGVVIT